MQFNKLFSTSLKYLDTLKIVSVDVNSNDPKL